MDAFLAIYEDEEESEDSDDYVEEMAGSVPVEGFSEVVMSDVEKLLSKLSKDLSVRMKEMLVQSRYQKEVTNAFGAIHGSALNKADINPLHKIVPETFPILKSHELGYF